MEGRRHFVLVHGMCHGAWCWFKVAAALEAAGHAVSAVDLAACGRRPESMAELRRFEEYTRPLLEALAGVPGGERVVLVGHSYGGLSLALAMERFPRKVAAAVFVTAVMPGAAAPLSVIAREYFTRYPPESFMDCEVKPSQGPSSGRPLTTVSFGPKYMSTMLYNRCSPEDLTLGAMLVRPGSWFLEDAATDAMVTAGNYESVSRVYVVCKEDRAMAEDFQRWIIDRSPGVAVEEIEGADHLAMLSKPKELCRLLLEIARKYQ